jgi:hypothetical protein
MSLVFCFTRTSTLLSISRAARFVKVTSIILEGSIPLLTSHARRYVKARVLPLPAPATTNIGPAGAVTTANCSSLRSAAKSICPAEVLDVSVNFLAIASHLWFFSFLIYFVQRMKTAGGKDNRKLRDCQPFQQKLCNLGQI